MTAVLAENTAGPRPATRPGLRALGWVTWRQHRAALTAIAAVLLLAITTMWWFGLRMHAHFAQLGLSDCALGRRTQSCTERLDAFTADQNFVTILATALVLLPVLFGVFLGAPMLAREYESGTFRFAFTQGAGRNRWLASRIALLTAFTVVATSATTLVVSWWYGPLVGLNGRLGGNIYESYGPVFVSRGLFALGLGILLGALLRRVVPAIAVTLAVWIAVLIASVAVVRSRLLAPLTAVDTAIPGVHPWVLGQTWTAPDGHVLSGDEVNTLQFTTATAGHKLDAAAYLAAQGYRYTGYYQPASRFWALQSIEAGGLALLALACIVGAVWLVRRRAS